MLSLVGYSDYICPYCYVGAAMMERTLAEYDATLEWRGFEIHPEIPEAGVPIEALDPRVLHGLKGVVGTIAQRHDVPMSLPSRLPNSRRALLGAEFARSEGMFAEYHAAVFQAYFIEDRDIGDPQELKDIAGGIGLDGGAFEAAVEAKQDNPVLESNKRDCQLYRIDGVPSWVINGRVRLVGALPPQKLRVALDAAVEEIDRSS